MTKEVIVSIKGLQEMSAENGDSVEMVSTGQYRYEKDQHIIQYEEIDEENQEITHVTIVIGKDFVEIIKSGQNNVQMMFQEEQKTTSCYQTPFGDLTVGMDTTKVSIEEQENEISVALEYGLDMNYSHVADCTITIRIMAKNTEI